MDMTTAKELMVTVSQEFSIPVAAAFIATVITISFTLLQIIQNKPNSKQRTINYNIDEEVRSLLDKTNTHQVDIELLKDSMEDVYKTINSTREIIEQKLKNNEQALGIHDLYIRDILTKLDKKIEKISDLVIRIMEKTTKSD